MFSLKHISKNFLSHLGLAIVLLTGILEINSPVGVFITWGYITGIFLTVRSDRKSDTVLAGILAFFLVLMTAVHMYGGIDSKILLFNCLYALAGVVITSCYVVRLVGSKVKEQYDKAQMESIFTYGTQGIILFNGEGRILLANPFAEKLFGYTPEEIEGKFIDLILPEIVYETFQYHNFNSSGDIEGDISLQKDLSVRNKNGKVFSVELSLNQYQLGGKQYNLAFIMDITQRKEHEEKLRVSKEELEKSNLELEAFSYSVSHDLRAPLRAVGSYAQMLEEDYGNLLDAEGTRLLHVIKKSASKMGMLIDDLLTFSRLGRTGHRKTEIDMTEFVNNTLGEINQLIKHKAQIVIYPLHRVMADTVLINQVLMNLISNAIKYSSKNEEPYIEVKSSEENGEVVFSISDNGVGFDMQYVHKLFGVFQRLHTTHEFEGTGVGLAIAKRIIDKHGGRMWAEAEQGKGASFYFALPIDSVNFINN